MATLAQRHISAAAHGRSSADIERAYSFARLSGYSFKDRILIRAGSPTAFTIDGPKGPRYIAKMGAVLLAKKTGLPILPFTITAKKFWEAKKSWDGFQVPKPFTRARVDIAPPIYVPPDADDKELEAKRDELQRALDEINRRGVVWRAASRT